MQHARAICRIVLLSTSTAILYLGWLLTRPLGLVSRDLGRRTQRFVLRTWARSCAATVGLRVTLRGRAPEPPFFLVCNHLSYLDVIVLMGVVDGTLLAKAEIARWPVIGFLARTSGTLFVERARRGDLRRVLGEIEAALADGRGVVVFPEGTSSAGEGVLPFLPSLFEAPLRARIPVHAAALTYRTPAGGPPAHQAVCWWGEMTFCDHLYALLGHSGLEAGLAFGAEPVAAVDRKGLARAAHGAVESLFTPVVGRLGRARSGPCHGKESGACAP